MTIREQYKLACRLYRIRIRHRLDADTSAALGIAVCGSKAATLHQAAHDHFWYGYTVEEYRWQKPARGRDFRRATFSLRVMHEAVL